MFQYILTEEQAPDWLMKTSLIDVRHDIRALLPFPTYRQDNQTFVSDYLQEVKPYHVQVKDFNLVYDGNDDYPGTVTDFDCPAYYDTQLQTPQYVSPILLPYTASTAVGNGTASNVADTEPTAEIWATTPWNEWYNNYLLSLQSVAVSAGGSGYTEAPEVIVGTEWQSNTAYTTGQQIFYRTNLYSVTDSGTSGDTAPEFTTGSQMNGSAALSYSGTAAKAVAVINSRLQVIAVNVTVEGSGYVVTPAIRFVSTSGSGAQAHAYMGNDLVRSMNMSIKYDRYEYISNITDWTYLVATYPAGTQVRYADRVWQATNTVSNAPTTIAAAGVAGSYTLTLASNIYLGTGMIVSGFGIPADTIITQSSTGSNIISISQALLSSIESTEISFYNPFIVEQWTRIPADTLSGIDRTQGFYLPTANQPGRSLPLLIDGLEYPGVQVSALDFSYNTGYDVGNYDINPFDNISYSPEGTPTYDPALLDAAYSSAYLDPFLGLRPTDINVDGGGYIDVFSSYAPEELVPGSEFDTLDMRVYTTPGSDSTGLGWGFQAKSIRYTYDPENPVLNFAGVLEYPFTIAIFNVTLGLAIEPVNYDWANYEVTVGLTETAGDVLDLYVTGVGGGNQLYLNTYLGNTIENSQIAVPFSITSISEFLIYNGEVRLIPGSDYTYAADGASSTTVTFANTYEATDRINLAVFGYTDSDPTRSWSLPVYEVIVSDGSSTVAMSNSLQGTNQVNLVVTVNGVRLRPYQGAEYLGNGSTVTFTLPNNNSYDPSTMSNNDVLVYIDNVKLTQGVGEGYVVNPYTGGARTITFTTAPAAGAKILASVGTGSEYRVYNDALTFLPGSIPNSGDIMNIVTWNDTSEQALLTQLFVGPSTSGNNTFDLGRVVTNPERLLVTLDGHWLFNGLGFTVDGANLIIGGSTVGPDAVLAVTLFTNIVVPDPMTFRIFQDMRGVQATYRITPGSTTALAQPVTAVADVIYVDNASALGVPNLALNIWGVVTIGAERIMYRYIDLEANTISGLLRGTAGTAVASHASGTAVYNMGRGNLMPETCQNYIVSNITYPLVSGVNLGDGTTTAFTATDIDISQEPIDTRDQTVIVYVGGERIQTGYTITADAPVTVTFDAAPPVGAEVTILVRRAHTWYDVTTPDLPLNRTDTVCARFLQGQ
jgi:hypothetical protein